LSAPPDDPNAILLTGDPEIEPLEGEQNLKVEWLPRKT
jgi:hypothetical protein